MSLISPSTTLPRLNASSTWLAQAAPASSGRPEDRSEEFVPVEGGREDNVSAPGMLFAAYLAMWLLVLFFVLQSRARQKGLDQRLGRLEEALRRAEKDADGDAAA